MTEMRGNILNYTATHPFSSAMEIAAALFVVPQTVRYHMRILAPVIVMAKRQEGGREITVFSIREGAINWCPHCGHVMERVKP
jgi:predicted transcriptional regulator